MNAPTCDVCAAPLERVGVRGLRCSNRDDMRPLCTSRPRNGTPEELEVLPLPEYVRGAPEPPKQSKQTTIFEYLERQATT